MDKQYRYIRVNAPDCLESLQESFGPVDTVPLVDGMYRIDKKNNINKHQMYQEGSLYGIDLGSAFAV